MPEINTVVRTFYKLIRFKRILSMYLSTYMHLIKLEKANNITNLRHETLKIQDLYSFRDLEFKHF